MAENRIPTKIDNPSSPVFEKQEDNSNFDIMPTGPATELMLGTLTAGKDGLQLLADRKKTTSHNKTKVGIGEPVKVTEKRKVNGIEKEITRNQVTIGQLNSKERITIIASDIDALIGSNKTAKKLFVFTLSKMAKKALSNGELYTTTLDFPLHELKDMGLYTDIHSARKGFTDGMDILTSMKVGGTINVTKKKAYSSEIAVLFPYAKIENGYCYVDLNPRINWDFVAQYYTKIPRYIYSLKNKAFDLAYYIFYLARQNTEEILKTGKFNIGFRAIQARLSLPDETTTQRPQRDIKDAMELAFEGIEEAHRKSFHNMELQLLPIVDDNLPIKEWLDTGKLQVTLKGDYSALFEKIATTTARKKELAEQQQKRIYEMAVAKNMAKKMEAEAEGEEPKAEAKPEVEAVS